MGTQFGQNCLCLLVGRAKAHIPGVRIMFPCALPWEEEPKERLLLQNLMAIRITPDSCPIQRTSTQSPTQPTSWLFWWACRGPLESLVEECICLVCPASNECCLPTASAQSGPTAGSPANPTIQLQSCESYPRIIPPNHTPNHTLESYHLFKLPGPTTVKTYTPI